MKLIARTQWGGAFLLVTACSPLGGTGAGPAPGHYGVALVDGQRIPAEVVAQAGCERILSGGTLELGPERRFRLSLDFHTACAGYSSADRLSHEGLYTTRGDSLEFIPEGDLRPFLGVAAEAEIAANPANFAITFRRGLSGETDLQAYYFEQIQREMDRQLRASQEENNGYDCRNDSLLDDAAPIPASDTAGIGARLGRHFPEWHLSTEHEIACRFPLGDGSRPEMYWEHWGSGRAWWIWQGDFDGDDRLDRLVLLTSSKNPSEDLLVVLFANGEAAEVTSVGGWGVAVGSGKGHRVEGFEPGESVVLRGDAIHLLYWEKASEMYYWREGRFESLTTGD